MELEVVGRHALLFDDDATAAFVNSAAPLVDWCSLLIDRYDVRHLLPHPPPPRSHHHHHGRRRPIPLEPDGVSRADLDRERFLNLPPPDAAAAGAPDHNPADEGEALRAGGSYQAVGFSYDNKADGSDDYQASDAMHAVSSFRPPFPVPEYLSDSLPPTERLHQIIARTAKFVAKHGAQSEIVLRVKQGDNPTFGFLMPDHCLHPYFRFLIDRQDLIEAQPNAETEEKKEGGSLMLLGSVYGEDDENEAKETPIGNNVGISVVNPRSMSKSSASLEVSVMKDKVHNKRHPLSVTKASTRKRVANSGALPVVASKKPPVSPVSSSPVDESLVVEPPLAVKEMVDRIVEFVVRNGKEVEAILIEQNRTKFPFLLSSNQYHPYYLLALRKAQKSKQFGRVVPTQICNLPESVKESSSLKSQLEGKLDTERKEKFKMVIGVSKKDVQEESAKSHCPPSMSADAAAAIVMAATKGFNKGRDSALKTVHNGFSNGDVMTSIAVKPVSSGDESFASLSNATGSLVQNQKKESGISFAKEMTKSAALASANETDSAEARLSKEQLQKAERLKRAKLFTAMIKNGAKPSNDMLSRVLSPVPDSAVSEASIHSGSVLLEHQVRGREGISATMEVKRNAKMDSERDTDDERTEETPGNDSSKSIRYEKEDMEENHKHSRKRHREQSSRHDKERHHRHKKSHSSSRKGSKRRHKHDSSSEDEHSHRSRSHGQRSQVALKPESPVCEYSSDTVNADANIENVLKKVRRSSPSRTEKDPKVCDTKEIPDDLRAKVRAMLMATL